MTRPTIAPTPVVSCAVADELSTTEQSSGRMAPDQTDSERCLFTGPCHHSSGHKRNPPRDDGGSPRSGEPPHPVGGCAPTIYRPCDVDRSFTCTVDGHQRALVGGELHRPRPVTVVRRRRMTRKGAWSEVQFKRELAGS